MGGSAGGHLVEYLGYAANTSTADHPAGAGPRVKAIIPLYGWSDLTDPAVFYQYYMELFLGKKYADAPKLYEEASPITHVDEGDPATLLLHGTIDTIVPITQSDKLAESWRRAMCPMFTLRSKAAITAMTFSRMRTPA